MMSELAEFFPSLLAGYFVMALGLLSPGPNILAIVGTSMGVSRKAGVLMACGVSAGSFVWATLAVLGVAALMAAYAPLAFGLKIAGGLYLAWIGVKYLRAAKANTSIAVAESSVQHGLMRYFGRGIFIQMTNPKAIFAWIATISIVSRPDAPFWILAIFVLGCTFLAFAGHIAWAYLFSTHGVIGFYDRFKRVINSILGTLLGALGAGLVLSAFKSGSKAT